MLFCFYVEMERRNGSKRKDDFKNRKERVEICGEFDIIYQNKYVLDSRNLQVIYKGGVTDSRIFRMYKTMRR